MYFILVPSIHLVVSLPFPFGGAVAASRHVVPPGGEENSRGKSAGRRSPELGVGLGFCASHCEDPWFIHIYIYHIIIDNYRNII